MIHGLIAMLEIISSREGDNEIGFTEENEQVS